ncbi:MAG: SCO family protein [Verrucomicrobia bacterium]|nr:SCO family protein [Verrucomicrobiota bacterium]
MKSYARAAVLGAGLAMGWSACSKHPEVSAPNAGATAGTAAKAVTAPPEKKGAEKKAADRYPLTGVVVSVDVPKKILVVQHDEIPDYMPAMTMEFIVSAGDAAVAKPGQRIRAEMIPSKTGDFRLEKIWPAEKNAVDAVAAGALKLRQDTFTLGKNAYREIGESAPEFTLYDQEGRVVPSGRFRGKMVMLNFIFTRCPVATMCPASTMKMISAQKQAAAAGAKGIEFVSITLDPAYDTPGVLKEYAAGYGINTANFSFLTGPEAAVRDLLTQFGVIAELKGELIQHTLSTILIGEDGKIIHREEGSAWEPKEFVARMRK